jgi:hypothetical protein
MWAAITESHSKVGQLLHLVKYPPRAKEPRDLGPVSVSNPNFTEFADKNGKPLPFHGGFVKVGDVTTTKYVIMGVCEAKSGDVYILALHPYSVLKVSAKELATKNSGRPTDSPRMNTDFDGFTRTKELKDGPRLRSFSLNPCKSVKIRVHPWGIDLQSPFAEESDQP